FGPDGIYGHDDHLMSHRTAAAAVERSGQAGYRPELGEAWEVPALYFTAAPRRELLAMFARRDKPGNGMPEERHALMGTPEEEITHWIDVARHSRAKHAAIVAHRTQTGEGGPIAGLVGADLERRLSRETFVLAARGARQAELYPIDLIAADLPWQGPRNET
ncbi:MAG: hypothetical protein ACR2J8_12360, partial [Thermomicrobiales bacterium]